MPKGTRFCLWLWSIHQTSLADNWWWLEHWVHIWALVEVHWAPCTCVMPLTVSWFVLRISMFDFVVDKTVSEPNITFVSEDPFLQYVRSFRLHINHAKVGTKEWLILNLAELQGHWTVHRAGFCGVQRSIQWEEEAASACIALVLWLWEIILTQRWQWITVYSL